MAARSATLDSMLRFVAALTLVSACARDVPAPTVAADPSPLTRPAPARAAPPLRVSSVKAAAPHRVPEPAAAPEVALGVRDEGVFADLDARTQLALPSGEPLALLEDRARSLLVAYVDGHPVKVYPLGGSAELLVAGRRLALRPGDRTELAPRVANATLRAVEPGQSAPPSDRDGDGIPDPLDLLVGATKTWLNGAHYDDGYFSLTFPGGDPPRDRGACVDVIVRALRNAGVDLQAEIAREVRAAPAAYGVAKADASIDHRRVRTVIHYFLRHWDRRSAELDHSQDPLRAGDVVFLDTFPNRPGPDHVGILAHERGESGLPLVINNWTFGTTTRPMDLLGSIPVTHRFRFPRG